MTFQATIKAYGGWKNTCHLSNGHIELIITLDVGPRIIHCGLVGGENQFAQYPAQLGATGGTEWRIYGGHRLWHAPEQRGRTYSPDNAPVEYSLLDDGIELRQATDQAGIRKALEIRLPEGSARARLTHRLTNEGQWTAPFAAWALSVMRAGGTAIIPLPARGSHEHNLLPKSSLVLWAYTNMSDPRWTWGREYILLRQTSDGVPQKIGANLEGQAWLAYINAGVMFVKTAHYQAHAPYPDMGSSLEVFTDHAMLELETLSPLYQVAPHASIEHVEDWALFDEVASPRQDAEVSTQVLPHVLPFLASLA